MRVFDLFPFYNELDLLELRLEELRGVADVHCLVELPVTFTGLPKPMYFKQRAPDFFRDKFQYYSPSAYPEGGHPMVDWFQRRQLARHIKDADPDDLVLLSDVDEIPKREIVEGLKRNPPEHPVALEMELYYHRVSLKAPVKWRGTIACKRKTLGEEPDLQELRDLRNLLPYIPNAGWHFSWMGSVEQIKDKLRAVDVPKECEIYGGKMFDTPSADPDFLESCRAGRTDLLGREDFKTVECEPPPLVGMKDWLMRHPVYA